MSIEKDVEKKYIDDLERQNKKLKKKKKKRLLLLLLILLLLGSLGLMLGLMGLLPGMGDGGSDDGSASSSANSSSASSSQAETSSSAIDYVYDDVKVSGSTYIYQGQVKTLEEIKTIISNMKDNVVIRITDDNATKNAMDNLTNMLSNSKRTYNLTNPASSDSSSASDSSSSQEDQSSEKD